MYRHFTSGLLVLLTVSVAAQQPQQVPGAIRSGISAVPIDVRVLDSQGKPVTDLKQEDFIVLEDGVRQKITQFVPQALTSAAPSPETKLALRNPAAAKVSSQNHRTFLLVLGRGRLQPPAKGVDGALKFVRERLLPQDLVAVLAWNRATDFTTDHAKVAQLLEQFKRKHESIESKLKHHFSGLQAVYGSKEIPKSIQTEIDGMFRAEGTPGARTLPTGVPTDQRQLKEDERRATDALQRAEIIANRAVPSPFDAAELARIEPLLDVSFDQFVEENAQTMQDLNNIYAGIQYMRYLEGEKHLVFFTERGLFLPRLESDQSVAALANDARVVIDTILTGGIAGPPPPQPMGVRMGLPPPIQPPGGGFRNMFAGSSLRNISDFTGGQSSINFMAEQALSRINDATLFQYLLGYYPSNPNWDGRYRRITVRVNRPGVRVLYRRGYYGRDQLVPFDRQQFLTYNRIASAGGYVGTISDIKLDMKASEVFIDGAPGEILAEVTIDVSKVTFTETDGIKIGALDIATFCGDGRQNLVGELWQKMEIKLRGEPFERAMKNGLPYTARVPIKGKARYVKVVVYDYGSDIAGSAQVEIK
jgi:VWFA-related protein